MGDTLEGQPGCQLLFTSAASHQWGPLRAPRSGLSMRAILPQPALLSLAFMERYDNWASRASSQQMRDRAERSLSGKPEASTSGSQGSFTTRVPQQQRSIRTNSNDAMLYTVAQTLVPVRPVHSPATSPTRVVSARPRQLFACAPQLQSLRHQLICSYCR